MLLGQSVTANAYNMIQEKINQLISVLQALTTQRANALRLGNMSEAQQIASVAVDVDAKIHELQQSIKLIKETKLSTTNKLSLIHI